MSEKMKIKNDKHSFIIISVILFLVLSCSLVIDAARNNSQAEWAIVPDIRLIGEYKIADGEWKDIVEGEHIPATKGDVMLRGVLEICDPETNDFYGKLTKGSLMYFTFNHINLALTKNHEITVVYDMENPLIGEDACGYNSMVIEYGGKDGYFEGVIRNYHSFGNEGAVDEFLSSMKLYASDYSEKTALRSGKDERVVAIMIIISAFLVLGLAIFSYIFDRSTFKNYLFGGLLILSAGLFFLFTSEAIYLWSDLLIVNTMLKGISAMAYLLFAFVLVKDLFSEKMQKVVGIAITKDYKGNMLFCFENGKMTKTPLLGYETKTNRKKLIGARDAAEKELQNVANEIDKLSSLAQIDRAKDAPEESDAIAKLMAEIDKLMFSLKKAEEKIDKIDSLVAENEKKINEYATIANKAKDEFNINKAGYDKIKQEAKPEIDRLKAIRDEKAAAVDKVLFDKYQKLKANKIVPTAPLQNSRCGGCHMEMPSFTVSNAVKNGYCECENCGRITYIE